MSTKRTGSQAVGSWLLAALAALLLAGNITPAWPQAASGTIEGYVYDPDGAVIPGATVRVTNPDTGLSRTTTADERGRYAFPQLPVGSYELTVTQAGFAELKRTGIVLQVGDRLSIDLTLQVGAVQTEIIVTEAAPVLEPSKTEVSTMVDQKLVSDLPLNGRNWTELALLTPGVIIADEFGSQIGNLSFAGVEGEFNNVQVDGADNNNAFFAEIRGRTRAVFQFSQETIREFRVANQNFAAEYGRAGGAIVNAVTKSGTNDLHGTVWYYFRDDGLNAQDTIYKSEFSVNSAGDVGTFTTQPPERRQQYGFNLGGPVIKDKVFFFFNMDNQQRNEPRIVVLGALGDEIVAHLNATPTNPMSANDRRLASRQQGFGQLAIDYFGPLVRPIPRTFDQINLFPRIDWRVNENHTVTFSHNYQRWRSENGFFTFVTGDDNLTADARNSTDSWTNILTLNSVLRPTLLNEFRFQFTWDNVEDSANAPFIPAVSLRGFRFTSDDDTHSLPGLFPGRSTKEQRNQWQDNLTWIKGRHTFKFGADANRITDEDFLGDSASGSYSVAFRTAGFIAGASTNVGSSVIGGFFENCINLTNYDAAIAGGATPAQALDTPGVLTPANCRTVLSSYSQDFFPFGLRKDTTIWDLGAYVQDSIRLHPRFTLYLGLRYEFQDLPNPCETLALPSASPDTCVINPLEPRTGYIPQDGNNWAPRLGFAWQPWEKWVVRGGYGIFYVRTPGRQIDATFRGNNVYVFNQFITCSTAAAPRCQNPPNPASVLDFPNPLTEIDPLDPSTAPWVSLSEPTTACPDPPACADPFADLFVFDSHRVSGYVQHGSLEIERQIGNNTTVSAAWLYTHGVHLTRVRNTNVDPVASTCPTASTTCTRLDVFDENGALAQQFFIPRYRVREFSDRFNRPNPDFRQILAAESSGSSIYHGLALRLQHRFSGGFSLLSSWTISKTIDSIRNAVDRFQDLFDPFNTELDRGLADLDRRQQFVTSWVWEPPYLREHDSRTVRALFANWRFTGIITAQQGRPIEANLSGGTTDTDLNEDAASFDRVPFVGRNIFRAPGFATLDFGVSKLVHFGERARAEFTFQAFNTFNSPVYNFFNDDLFVSTRTGGSAARVFQLRPNPDFLEPLGSRRGRDIQLGFRFTF